MCCIWLGAWNHNNLPKRCNMWMWCVNGNGDESGQACNMWMWLPVRF
jgi:hypothetical protein